MEINIRSEVNDISNEIISIRRDIHKHPELGFEVHRTAELVSKHLNYDHLLVQYNESLMS